MVKVKDLNGLLLKEPFKRINATLSINSLTNGREMVPVGAPSGSFTIVTQDDFMRQYDPSGHIVNNPYYYADREKVDDSGKVYRHFVERYSTSMQDIITVKQLVHLCGNPIQFTNTNPTPSEYDNTLLMEFRQAWQSKNMEVALFESYKMEKITGDSAFCGYMSKGKFGWRTFGYTNGEVLYPHYDRITGELDMFARKYHQMDEDGSYTEFVDVWDETTLSTYSKNKGVIGKLRKAVGLSDWYEVASGIHGFSRIPIAYKRSDRGACWSFSQDAIDKYELAVSQLCENNKFYAFRILFLSGSEVDVSADSGGSPTVIRAYDPNAEAKFLERADASSSFELQLKVLKESIFTSSFTVLPPEVKGGDLPGVTIKILYSPAVEKAMIDAKEWNLCIDNIVAIFREGYGLESTKTAQFSKLNLRGDIIPYVHQNDQEIINNINSSLTMGSLSAETSREIHPYAKNDENTRAKAEDEAEQQAQLKAEELKLNKSNQARQDAGI